LLPVFYVLNSSGRMPAVQSA